MSQRGSVLLEFLIVLPIYMLLLGFSFVYGELALRAIHLAGGADRSYAMLQNLADFKKAVSPHTAYINARDDEPKWDSDSTWKDDDQISYDYSGDPAGGSHKASKYQGRYGQTDGDWMANVHAWTKTVAAYVENSYALTPVTRGFVAFWRWDIDQKREAMGDTESIPETAVSQMLDSGVERASITGKDLYVRDDENQLARRYGYYSLQRSEQGRGNDRLRGLDAGNLAESEWEKAVADDPAPTDEDIWMSEQQDGDGRGEGEQPTAKNPPSKEFPDEWTR